MGAKSLEPLDPETLGGEHDEYEITPSKKCQHGGHFRYVRPNEIRCDKCGVGYYIDSHDRLKDGHLYRRDTLVI